MGAARVQAGGVVMATTFDTEREAQAAAAELNAAAGREPHVRYQVERYREKWAIARQSKRTYWGWEEFLTLRPKPATPQWVPPKPSLSTSDSEASGFRIRLRVRIPKSFMTEADSLTVTVMNKAITITSQVKAEPLNKAKWIVLNARGFPTEEAAREFGGRLRSILLLAALSSRLGVDAGDDKITTWMNEEFARKIGLRDDERIAPSVHGLSILPDDDKTRFPVSNLQATITTDPQQFTSALKELGEQEGEMSFGAASDAVRILLAAPISEG